MPCCISQYCAGLIASRTVFLMSSGSLCLAPNPAMFFKAVQSWQVLQVIDIAAWLEGHATPEDEVHVVMDLGDGR